MSVKKVYFYQITLYDKSEKEISFLELKKIFSDIIENEGYKHDEYYSLDVSSLTEPLHIVWDVFDYKSGRLFFRLSKQKPSNSVIQREYNTYKKKDILPVGSEKHQGIEQYTFGSFEYDTGIFSIVSSKGAPGLNVLKNVFERYRREIEAEFIPIPNTDAIESIYYGQDPEISQIEIELPLPNAETLEHVFGWKESEILDTLIKRNLNLNVVIKGIPRSMITFGADETKGLIQCITSHLNEYRKAKMKARDKKEKLKDYNFFEDNFSYPIDIVEYHIVNYERVYYTVEELVEIYKRNIVSAYLENKEILRTIIGR